MTVTKDWQAELAGGALIGGADSAVRNIDGLGQGEAKTRDAELDLADGSVLGPDFSGTRLLVIDASAFATSECGRDERAVQAVTKAKAITDDWAPRKVDVMLTVQLPGYGRFTVMGKPRLATMDLSTAYLGVVPILLHFLASSHKITPVGP